MIWLGLLIAIQAMSAPLGDSSDEAVEAALRSQIERNLTQLTLPNAPPIYHLRYHILEISRMSAIASLGSLVEMDTTPLNSLAVEVRVGTPSFDNTGFVGWQNGFARTPLPLEVTDYSVALSAWRLTDRAYKQAVEQFSRKKAQFIPPESYPGDYWLTGPSVFRGEAPAGVDLDALSSLGVQLSSQLVLESGVERGEVHIGYEAGLHQLIDSEGSFVIRPVGELSVRGFAHVRATDGALISDHRTWSTTPSGALPAQDLMERELGEMMRDLDIARAAEPLIGEYVGPVLFEDAAALDLFRYILVPQLEGTPPEVPFDSWFGELGASSDPVRLGRRVLPPGWTAVDDPAGEVGPGYFEYDLEGSLAKRVELVEDGIVRSVLMSRIPRRGLEASTGHARGYPGDRAEARVSQLTVQAPDELSVKRLRKQALKAAAAYERDWVYVVRRLQEPAVMAVGSRDWSLMSEATTLPPPVVVFRLDASGVETPIRGARFANVSRWILRDVQAAGALVGGSYFASLKTDGYYSSPLEGLPTRLSVPAVLIGELELVATPGDPKEIRTLKVPTQ
jgi:hypothetical protein